MWRLKIILVYCLCQLRLVASHKTQKKITISDNDPPRVFFFVFSGLAIAGVLRALTKMLDIPIPFRVHVLFVGGIVGAIASVSQEVKDYSLFVHIPHRYFLMACLPILMFRTAFCIEAHAFIRSWGQIFVLAVPGIIINAVFTGVVTTVLGNHNWTYPMGLLFGTVCSSIYPFESVALLKEIGQAKHLSILLEGESMIGDGTVIIMYEVLLGMIDDYTTDWYQLLILVSRFSLGGIALGYILGRIMGWIMSAMYSDVVNLLILSIVAAYLTYYIAEEFLAVSSVISVVILGIMMSMEKPSLSVEVELFLVQVWETLSFIASTLVFLAAGVIMAERLMENYAMQDYALVPITYVVVGVGRLLQYILLAPIVSRIGYGLTFKNMTIAVWSGLRGPFPFCLTLRVYHHSQNTLVIGKELLVHITGLVILTLLINATSMPILLRLLGLSELSISRKVNMNNCMRHLQNRRERTIAMLKMDRFLADANWPLVNKETLLKHPYKINYDTDDDEENYLGFRITTCPECQKEIPNDPTQKEMVEMTREARMRILKAKKISYARQYENGMLSKEGIRVLTQAIETAMDTPEALIELDGLHKYFKRQGFMQYTRRRLLNVFFKRSESGIKPPRRYWRRVCYYIVVNPAFDFFIYSIILLNVIPIGMEIGLMPKTDTQMSLGLKIANTFFFIVYFMEFALKIYGYSWIYIFEHGVKTYFKSYWNTFDFFVLCVCAVDLVLDYVDLFSTTFNKVDSKASKVTVVTKLIRVIRLVRLLRLCKAWYPKLIQYCDSKIDKHLAFAYDVGKGFVTGEEEVSDMLIQMIDNKAIREQCRLRMEADRLAITKELGMVQKDRPWIAITVKTRQAVRATVNSMMDALLELKVSGWVDDVEYAKLMESLEERLKYVRTRITSVQPSPPKVIFKEVAWMADDEQIANFLYEHIVTKVFDQGDIVCAEGEMSDGIYIVVTGLLKLEYTPKKEVLDNLEEYGILPVIDYITSARFDEKIEDYIVSGNCIGELSTLTGRPYNCTITADTTSQTYILTHDIIKQAIQRCPDPINGLESKIWKSISIRLTTSILLDTATYQSSTLEKIRFHLERAFVPDLSRYKVFGVNDMMEDIVLIEGVAFDYNTRDCYTAPCYIPRTVQKIVLPRSSHMNLDPTMETKLLIIPAQDVDEFDIMEKEEDISELVSTASVKCLQHVIQTRQSLRLKKRKKRLPGFGIGHRRLKHRDSRISGTPSVYYSRSRTTEASSYETELGNISMNDTEISNLTYVINERSYGKPSRNTSRRNSKRHSLESNQYKKLRGELNEIKSQERSNPEEIDESRSKKSISQVVLLKGSKAPKPRQDQRQSYQQQTQYLDKYQESESEKELGNKIPEENKTNEKQKITKIFESMGLLHSSKFSSNRTMSTSNKYLNEVSSKDQLSNVEKNNTHENAIPRSKRSSDQSSTYTTNRDIKPHLSDNSEEQQVFQQPMERIHSVKKLANIQRKRSQAATNIHDLGDALFQKLRQLQDVAESDIMRKNESSAYLDDSKSSFKHIPFSQKQQGPSVEQRRSKEQKMVKEDQFSKHSKRSSEGSNLTGNTLMKSNSLKQDQKVLQLESLGSESIKSTKENLTLADDEVFIKNKVLSKKQRQLSGEQNKFNKPSSLNEDPIDKYLKSASLDAIFTSEEKERNLTKQRSDYLRNQKLPSMKYSEGFIVTEGSETETSGSKLSISKTPKEKAQLEVSSSRSFKPFFKRSSLTTSRKSIIDKVSNVSSNIQGSAENVKKGKSLFSFLRRFGREKKTQTNIQQPESENENSQTILIDMTGSEEEKEESKNEIDS